MTSAMTTPNEIPPLPADAATVDYALCVIRGALRWAPLVLTGDTITIDHQQRSLPEMVIVNPEA